jgi:hypothetical protein
MRDVCQTQKYAQFMERYNWKHEWRRGNLFLFKRKFGLTFETCYFPSKKLRSSDLQGNFCQVECCDSKLPNPFACNWTHTVKIDLGRNIEEIWTSLRKHARNAIRRSRDRGVWFRAGEEADFDVFWKMYEYGAARQAFLTARREILLDYLKTDFCRVFLVGIGDNTIGAYLVLEGEGVARYLCGGFSYRYQHFRPNNLAHWDILEYYKNKRFSAYYMGTCGSDHKYGLYSFKTDFGKPVITWNCKKANPFVEKMISLYRYLIDSRRSRPVLTSVPHS